MTTIYGKAIQSIFERTKKLSQVAFRWTQDALKLVVSLAFFGIIFGLYAWGVVAIWPSGFFDTAFAYMTPAMLIRAAAAAVGVVVGILLAVWLLVYLSEES